MKFVVVLAALVTISITSHEAIAKTCKTGKPCGNSCIAQDKECHVDAKTVKDCKKGKPCGNTCIAKEKTCNIP